MTNGTTVEGEWPLVARDDELSRLAAVVRGDAAVATVHGASGTGKSRLLAEFARRAEAEGAVVVRVSGTHLLRAVPLGALASFLVDRAALDAASADPGSLFAMASARVEALGGGRSVVVVVDDVPLVDLTSLTLVAQLAAARRIRLVASASTGEPIPDPIAELWTALPFLRIDLAPFERGEVLALLEAALGGRVAQRTASHLAEVSGGHLLYLREIVLGALEEGALRRADGGWRLAVDPAAPPKLRDLLVSRVAALPEAQRDVLERLAVCGEIPVAQLRGTGARAALEPLERSGAIVVSDGSEGLVARVAQPVLAGALTGAISRLRRADILGEQADIAAEQVGAASDDARIVTWRLSAGVPLEPARVRSAARLAREASDFRTVLALTEAGLRGGRDAELLLLRGEALLRGGRVGDALDVLDIAHGVVPPELMPAFAAVTATAHANRIGGREDGLRVIEAALADLGTADQLLSLTRALILLRAERVVEATAQADEVLATAEAEADAAARVALARAVPLAAVGRIEEALAAARLAVDHVARIPGPGSPGLTRTEAEQVLAEVLLDAMRPAEARRVATSALVDSIDNGDELLARTTEALLGRIAYFAGDLDAAERWNEDTRSGASVLGPEALILQSTGFLAMTAASRGEIRRARELLASVAHIVDGLSTTRIAPYWIDGCEGDVDPAVAGLIEVARRLADEGNLTFSTGAVGMVLELDRALVAVDVARENARRAPASEYVTRTADHAEAAASGDADRLLAIADEWERLGALRSAATAGAVAARSLRASGTARSAAAAQARAEELAKRCGGLMTPVLRFGDELSPLTRRERQIATLAAQGITSKDIAAKLFLSARTVDNHLQSVYSKLGINGRHELQAS